MTREDGVYGAVSLAVADECEERRATTRFGRLALGLTVGLLAGAGAIAHFGRSDVGAGAARIDSSLGQVQSAADKVRQVLVEALDHLTCTKTCATRFDTLAAKVEHNDTALVCGDFTTFASSDACVQECTCEDRTVISTAIDTLCGPTPPENPEDVFGDAYHESLIQTVMNVCPASVS